MTLNILTCPNNVTTEDLSALRDDMLDATTAARLRRHVATCLACQARMTDYDMLGNALRQPRPPEMIDELWRSVMREHARQPRRDGAPPRAVWLGAASVTVVALVVLLVGIVPRLGGISSHTATPTIAVTATTPQKVPTTPGNPTPLPTIPVTVVPASGPPVQGPIPAWQTYTLPAGFTTWNGNTPSFGVAASNPNRAYVCNTLGAHGQPAQVIATQDRGAHWTRVGDPVGLNIPCQRVVVDDADPAVVVVQNGASTAVTNDVSLDGGATWQQSAGLRGETVFDLASWHGRYYALLSPDSGKTLHIAASTDRLQTWHSIDTTLGEQFTQFWVDPHDGSVQVATSATDAAANSPRYHLWSTQDDGQHWFVRETPILITSAAFDPLGNEQLCGTAAPSQGFTSPLTVVCGDGGVTWIARPTLSLKAQVHADLDVVASDGTLYAHTTMVENAITIYRLRPGETRWEDLGPLSGLMIELSVYPTANGVLWTSMINDSPANQIATAPIP